jgi:hypothetical protein
MAWAVTRGLAGTRRCDERRAHALLNGLEQPGDGLLVLGQLETVLDE